MADALADVERVIADQLRFKQRLQIGEDAYAVLRLRKTLFSLWDSGGAAWTGAGIAKSAAVAGTFFVPAAPTGVLAWLGLAAPAIAVTPVGWVIAAGLAAGGGYYGVTRWLASGPDQFVETIPKFINTPIDLLGEGLFEFMATLALRVALIDGHVDASEREAIAEHFIADWGYDATYVAATLPTVEACGDSRRLSELARGLAEFQAANPDCNASAMQAGLVHFLRDVIAADGVITAREERAIKAIEGTFQAQRAVVSRAVTRRARVLASAANAAMGQAARTVSDAAQEVDSQLRMGMYAVQNAMQSVARGDVPPSRD